MQPGKYHSPGNRQTQTEKSLAIDLAVGDFCALCALTLLCHFTWPTNSWLSCCCSQLLLLCYNTTNS
ncbi:unnamed protein product [Staurois parvus]|uniref:Uncharacterized protein n=1 Tax=Staurois parvus TaxID=386267 RepID=A0ABN9AEZ1_9NEOB|nr:unnamed protein product [Staurois parvus]